MTPIIINTILLPIVIYQKTINLTADYYRMSDSSSEITSGSVKGMLEVIIQEE